MHGEIKKFVVTLLVMRYFFILLSAPRACVDFCDPTAVSRLKGGESYDKGCIRGLDGFACHAAEGTPGAGEPWNLPNLRGKGHIPMLKGLIRLSYPDNGTSPLLCVEFLAWQ